MTNARCDPLACPNDEVCPVRARGAVTLLPNPGIPTVLVIGAEELPDAAAIAVPGIHITSLRSREPCWCGAAHHPCELVAIRIHVRSQPPRMSGSATLDIALVSSDEDAAPSRCSVVVASPEVDFDAWSRTAIRNLTQCVLSSGLLGYDTADLFELFARPTRCHLIYRGGTERFPALARDALADPGFDRETTIINLGLHGFASDTLAEIDEAARVVTSALNDAVTAHVMVFATTQSTWHGVTILFSAPE